MKMKLREKFHAFCHWNDIENLTRAGRLGRVGTINRLLRRSVDVNAKNGFDWTALQYAVSCGQTNAVKALLAAGANPNIVCGNSTALDITEPAYSKKVDPKKNAECRELLTAAGAKHGDSFLSMEKLFAYYHRVNNHPKNNCPCVS